MLTNGSAMASKYLHLAEQRMQGLEINVEHRMHEVAPDYWATLLIMIIVGLAITLLLCLCLVCVCWQSNVELRREMNGKTGKELKETNAPPVIVIKSRSNTSVCVRSLDTPYVKRSKERVGSSSTTVSLPPDASLSEELSKRHLPPGDFVRQQRAEFYDLEVEDGVEGKPAECRVLNHGVLTVPDCGVRRPYGVVGSAFVQPPTRRSHSEVYNDKRHY